MSNKGWYSTKGRVCYLIFTAGVMTLIAICIIRVWTQHKRITSCRKAEGIVLEKKIEKIKYGAHRGVSTTYEPKIKYQYEVDGQRYVCNNLTPVIQGSRGKHTWAQSVVEKFKIGQTIQVYYNPENPQEAL